MLIRMDVNDISVIGRNTQGVRLIRLADDELVATVAKLDKEDEAEMDDSIESEEIAE